jgi:hypothetical protein
MALMVNHRTSGAYGMVCGSGVRPGSSQMLAFDARFVPDGVEEGLLGCILWADEPKFGRVRFHLGSFILLDVLHGANPVHQDENVKFCESCRPRIEKACRRAFARDPDTRVEVRSIDFR